MGTEIEWKFRADKDSLAAIEAAYGPFTPITMESDYYDTMDLKLAIRRWTFRRRRENGVTVYAFKSPAEGPGRNEWEIQADTMADGIWGLCANGAPRELLEIAISGLFPFCGARFTRLAKRVSLGSTEVELALDQGVLIGLKGAQKIELPFAELEVELKSGSPAEAEVFAKALAAKYGLVPEPKSKMVRARALTFAELK